MRDATDSLAWETRLPILMNVFLWYDLAKVFLIVYLVTVALMATLFVLAGDPTSVVRFARVFAIVCAGLLVASMSVAALWYVDRAPVRYELTPRGVRYQTLARRDRIANRILVVLGLLVGRPAAAGSGLLAMARESEFTPWTAVTRVREHASLGVVSLMNRWRVVQRLHCGDAEYPRVVRYVREHLRGGRS